MRFDDHRVVITAAGRDFGRTLAIRLADLGAEVFLSARTLAAAERVRDEIRGRGHQQVHAYACDLTDPASIRDFTAGVARHTDRIDVLIVDTIASGATGTVLTMNTPHPATSAMTPQFGLPTAGAAPDHEPAISGLRA